MTKESLKKLALKIIFFASLTAMSKSKKLSVMILLIYLNVKLKLQFSVTMLAKNELQLIQKGF